MNLRIRKEKYVNLLLANQKKMKRVKRKSLPKTMKLAKVKKISQTSQKVKSSLKRRHHRLNQNWVKKQKQNHPRVAANSLALIQKM